MVDYILQLPKMDTFCLFASLFLCFFVCLCLFLPFLCLFVCPALFLCSCFFVSLFFYLFVCLLVCLFHCFIVLFLCFFVACFTVLFLCFFVFFSLVLRCYPCSINPTLGEACVHAAAGPSGLQFHGPHPHTALQEPQFSTKLL